MNPIMTCYCRAFQLVFRLAMPLMPYREPERLEGIQVLLAQSGIRCTAYDGTRANPTVQNVEEAREQYLAGGCQGLIAFGGGGGSGVYCRHPQPQPAAGHPEQAARDPAGGYPRHGRPRCPGGQPSLPCAPADGQIGAGAVL
ncbi:MAG: iron-containing alcohol dehydrogenase [Oscillospiraceae bacterium]|nr:iron-containing alcohol dehydrogenase [Oscillospiraceae bacterium]